MKVRQTREAGILLDREIVTHRLDIGGDGQPGRADDAGHDAGDEHLHHRGLRHHRVEDHRDRRRDDDGEAGRGRRDGGGEFLGIAARAHGRDQEGAERGDAGHRRAGNLGEEHRGADHHHRQAAADEAEQRRGEGDQPARERRHVHDRAGQDEQRDRQQREIGGAVEHDQRRYSTSICGSLHQHHRRHGGEPERDGDRHVDQRQREHAEEHEGDGHGRCLLRRLGLGRSADMLERFLDFEIDKTAVQGVAHAPAAAGRLRRS